MSRPRLTCGRFRSARMAASASSNAVRCPLCGSASFGLERRRQMLRDGVGQRERPGKTGLGSQADQTRTAKMFMLTIQEIQRAVSGAAHTAELLNNAFGQGVEIGHRADFSGETSHQIQEMCG